MGSALGEDKAKNRRQKIKEPRVNSLLAQAGNAPGADLQSSISLKERVAFFKFGKYILNASH